MKYLLTLIAILLGQVAHAEHPDPPDYNFPPSSQHIFTYFTRDHRWAMTTCSFRYGDMFCPAYCEPTLLARCEVDVVLKNSSKEGTDQ